MKKFILLTCLALTVAVYSQEPAAPHSSCASNWIVIAAVVFIIASLAGIGVFLFMKNKKINANNAALKHELDGEKDTVRMLKQSLQEANDTIGNCKSEIEKLTKILEGEFNDPGKQPPPSIKTDHEEPAAGFVVYYANYKPQDGFFGKFSEENDGYSLWEITMESPTSATYALADINPYRYAERWFDIARIVKCDIPPTGTIVSGETINPGHLFKNDLGKWKVDLNNPVEIRFICK